VSDQVINVGLLGLGTVGTGAARILTQNAEPIASKVGTPIRLRRVAVRNPDRLRDIDLPAGTITGNAQDVVNDPEIDIVCELIGGLDPAMSLIETALRNGKHVVTANKEMMAKGGNALLHLAEERGLDFHFEASVAGGIPIIQGLKQALAGNRFSEIIGIVNGTTNYILSKMTAEGAEFADVLAEAQQRGYAEADPTSDVGGFDAQYKIAILASIAFNSRIDLSSIFVEGIQRIAKRDIEVARELGFVVKLVGIGQETDGSVAVRVHPALLPASHPLAAVNDVYNAVYVRGDAVGDVMFYGRGAGSMPTGSAVVGDIIEIARNIRRGGTGRLGCTCFRHLHPRPIDLLKTKYYVRLVAHDRPKALASLANIFGDFDVSIERVVQTPLAGGDAEVVWITHECLEANVRLALDVIGRLSIVGGVQNWIRVVE
jgi:homoserine dehydrogenase